MSSCKPTSRIGSTDRTLIRFVGATLRGRPGGHGTAPGDPPIRSRADRRGVVAPDGERPHRVAPTNMWSLGPDSVTCGAICDSTARRRSTSYLNYHDSLIFTSIGSDF